MKTLLKNIKEKYKLLGKCPECGNNYTDELYEYTIEKIEALMNKKGKAIAHRSNKENDNIATPLSASMQVIEKFGYTNLTGRVMEPCVGKQFAIARVLKHYIPENRLIFQEKELIKNPLFPYKQQDFLTMLPEETEKYRNAEFLCEYIVTNPPFSLFDKFVRMARRVCSIGFIFIAKLQFFTGQDRLESHLFYPGQYNLKEVYNFSRQCQWDYPLQKDGRYPAGMQHYCAYVFKRGYSGKAEIDFIDNNPYIIRKG